MLQTYFLQELLIDDSKEEQDDGIKLTSLKHLDNKGYEEDDTGSGWLLTNDMTLQLPMIPMSSMYQTSLHEYIERVFEWLYLWMKASNFTH